MNNHSARENLIWACASLALGVAALLIWQLVPAQSDGWAAFDRTVQGLAAFGTLGAVIVSLWIALRQSRLTERNAVETSMMYAAGIAFDLSDAYKELWTAINIVHFEEIDQTAPKGLEVTNHSEDADYRMRVRVNSLRMATSHRLYSISSDEIARLSALPKSAANHLHAAVAMIRAVDAELQRAQDPLLPFRVPSGVLRRWHSSCSEAARHLTVAHSVISEAAKLSAPRPTSAQLYGDDD